MQMLKKVFHTYKEPIAYIFFGVLTTLVNILAYYLCSDVLGIYYLLANVIAWVTSVLFAFVTNKLFVFESKSWTRKIVVAEMGGFFLARVATGVLDMALMWLLMDIAQMDKIDFSTLISEGGDWVIMSGISGEMLAKILVNVVVIVLNYVASKLWIFRKM